MFKTKILPATDENCKKAAELINQSEIVAIPTETVYGLAADIKNELAIKKLFKAKQRPQDNPLIIHVSTIDMISNIAESICNIQYKLIKTFWPGPLTIIFKKNDNISNTITCGLDTVGVRMPDNKITIDIINQAKTPLAAPSANISGSPSPTCAQHVYNDLNGKIPVIIDGGICNIGVESTVVTIENETIKLLRPGKITLSDLQNIHERVTIDRNIYQKFENIDKPISPGVKYKHYSPKARVILIKSSFSSFYSYVNSNKSDNFCTLVFDEDLCKTNFPAVSYGSVNIPEQQANQLFDKLRYIDLQNFKILYVRCPSDTDIGLAVYNRLLRAANFEVIYID